MTDTQDGRPEVPPHVAAILRQVEALGPEDRALVWLGLVAYEGMKYIERRNVRARRKHSR